MTNLEKNFDKILDKIKLKKKQILKIEENEELYLEELKELVNTKRKKFRNLTFKLHNHKKEEDLAKLVEEIDSFDDQLGIKHNQIKTGREAKLQLIQEINELSNILANILQDLKYPQEKIEKILELQEIRKLDPSLAHITLSSGILKSKTFELIENGESVDLSTESTHTFIEKNKNNEHHNIYSISSGKLRSKKYTITSIEEYYKALKEGLEKWEYTQDCHDSLKDLLGSYTHNFRLLFLLFRRIINFDDEIIKGTLFYPTIKKAEFRKKYPHFTEHEFQLIFNLVDKLNDIMVDVIEC